MKTPLRFLTLFTIVLCFLSCSKDEQELIPLSEVRYWAQEELDEHRARLLAADQLEGDVYLTEVTDLSALQNLRSITGQLRIQYTDLEDLEALSKLESVGSLKIDVNPQLRIIELENLKTVDENLLISTNDALREVSFPRLERVGVLDESSVVQKGGVNIANNENLLTVALNNLQTYSGLGIQRNDRFTSLTGLTNPPESAFSWRNIRLEFAKMDCPADLLEQLNDESEFEIKIRQVDESAFTWLRNVQPESILKFYGDIAPEDLCVLAEIITDYPGLLKVFAYDATINHSFTGFEVLENCQ